MQDLCLSSAKDAQSDQEVVQSILLVTMEHSLARTHTLLRPWGWSSRPIDPTPCPRGAHCKLYWSTLGLKRNIAAREGVTMLPGTGVPRAAVRTAALSS